MRCLDKNLSNCVEHVQSILLHENTESVFPGLVYNEEFYVLVENHLEGR